MSFQPGPRAWARIKANGTVESCFMCNTDVLETQKVGLGLYTVDFLFGTVQGLPRLATLDTLAAGTIREQIGLADEGGDVSAVFVRTTDMTGADADRSFTLFIF